MASPRVAVIVLNWNGRDDTLRCLASLRTVDYPDLDVVVVDNGSRDDSVAAIAKGFPEFDLVRLARNCGYAEGNNVGIRHALRRQPEFVFVLNNDTEVDPTCVRKLVETAARLPEAGAFGPKTYRLGTRSVLYSVGLDFNWLTGHVSYVGWGELDNRRHDREREFDVINGHALFLRATTIDKVGLFDPEFFAYNEETDYCLRIARAGFRLLYVPSAIVFHKGESTTIGLLRQYLICRNHVLCMRRNGSPPQLAAFYAYYFLMDLPRQLVGCALRGRWQHMRAVLLAVGWNLGLRDNPFERSLRRGADS